MPLTGAAAVAGLILGPGLARVTAPLAAGAAAPRAGTPARQLDEGATGCSARRSASARPFTSPLPTVTVSTSAECQGWRGCCSQPPLGASAATVPARLPIPRRGRQTLSLVDLSATGCPTP